LNTPNDLFIEELVAKGIRPSYQRVRVLEYLHRKDSHPTVDEIFNALAPEIPSLSRATIYNTLHTFVDAGLARIINIDDNELRYDLTVSDHGHFKCDSCGQITNFSIDLDRISVGELQTFNIKERNVYFRGLCPNCLNNQSGKE